jgi:hypothetical protein
MRRSKTLLFLFFFCYSIYSFGTTEIDNDKYLVIDGKPNAVIIIGTKPERAVVFAAKEFQLYIRKISGALIPIVKESGNVDEYIKEDGGKTSLKSKKQLIKIYIGQSNGLKKLNLAEKDLKWGAYRMLSGENWLALFGDDKNFTPKGLYPKYKSEEAEISKQWEELTNYSGWDNIIARKMLKKYSSDLDLWAYDHKGSLNAVYNFLENLGVRWFMPGELGEHIPKKKDITFSNIDILKAAHFKIRKASFMRYGNGKSIQDDILWSLRLGMNSPNGYDTYHGMSPITRSKVNRKNHPEYYALYNGKRVTAGKSPNPCLSSEGLFQENLRYLRTMFDMYDLPAMSVWPDDGFTRICECDKCFDKATRERGSNGLLSDYVWEYVNNIAIEIEKTHPDKKIIGGAYSTYFLPPEDIDHLNSNVQVHLVNARRRFFDATELKKYNFSKDERIEIARKWSDLAEGDIINFMNFGGAANTPNVFAEDIKAMQNYFIGEDMWVPHEKGGLAQKGFYHLNYYIGAKLWWEPDLDIDQLLNEYYTLFYGPAAEEMKTFINYFEVHQQNFGPEEHLDKLEMAIKLFDEAKKCVEENTIYAQRLQMFEKGMEKYRFRYNKLKTGRDDVPTYRARAIKKSISNLIIDGNLDEDFWRTLSAKLVDNTNGRAPDFSTTFKIGYHKHFIFVGLMGEFDRNKGLNVSSSEKDDVNIWNGDYIDILVETPSQSFYQISINPDGIVTDVDHSNSKFWGLRWESDIELVSKVDKSSGTWTIEAKIPITTSDQDPLHEIVGIPPQKENFPWYFNICRRYEHKNGIEYSAFSPTRSKTFLDAVKFAKMKR